MGFFLGFNPGIIIPIIPGMGKSIYIYILYIYILYIKKKEHIDLKAPTSGSKVPGLDNILGMNKDGSSDKGTSMGVQNWRSGCTSLPTSVLIPDVMPFKLEVSTVNLIDLLTVPHSLYPSKSSHFIYNIHAVTTLKYTNFKIYEQVF
jgi:hypothetical protein